MSTAAGRGLRICPQFLLSQKTLSLLKKINTVRGQKEVGGGGGESNSIRAKSPKKQDMVSYIKCIHNFDDHD